MRLLIIIFSILSFQSITAQHVIKVKKTNTITGAFYAEGEDKMKDYFLFTEDGYVYIIEQTKKKPKKALKALKVCASNPDCNEFRTEEYTFEKNVVHFAYGNTTYVKDYEGQFEDGGAWLVFKVSETDKILIVKRFKRIE